MNDSLALEKKKQGRVSKKFNKLKKRVKVSGGNVKPKSKTRPERGVVYVGHLPHGFFEKEMKAYFKQFGKVSHVRLCRSEKSGRSQGYAFVEFANAEVAKVAANTMNNYLMCNRRLVAHFISDKKAQKQVFMKTFSPNNYPLLKKRKIINSVRNSDISDKNHLNKCKEIVARTKKTLNQLKALGIEYNFKAADDEYNFNEKYFNNVPVKESNVKLKKEK